MISTNHMTRKHDKLQHMPWFHGKISREEAERLLIPREDGLYLVRESTNYPGDYTLCVCYQGKVDHYRVICDEKKFTIDEEEFFDTLDDLIVHYESDADGLCTQLVRSVPKHPKVDLVTDCRAFEKAGWLIQKGDIAVGETLGKGEFGDVVLGTWKGQKVAVKTYKDPSKSAQEFLAEASVMTTLRHPNLVKLLGIVVDHGSVWLVTEFMAKGSLVDFLHSRGRLHVTKEDQINFSYDTCSAMEYLESKRIVHRDLAARNVLISASGEAKVSDFGLARMGDSAGEGGKLPIKWTAPEALRHSKFSSKSDMWSFGILLWEIYSFGRVPYPRIPRADVMKHIEKGYRMECPDGCPKEIYDLMRQAWDIIPEKRPSFSEALQRLHHIKLILLSPSLSIPASISPASMTSNSASSRKAAVFD